MQVRLMRIATTLGPFKEVGTEEYSHTEYSKVYLQPQMRGMLKVLLASLSLNIRRNILSLTGTMNMGPPMSNFGSSSKAMAGRIPHPQPIIHIPTPIKRVARTYLNI